MSRHAESDPASRMRIVVEGHTNHDTDVTDRLLALLGVCALEVHGDVMDDGVERLDERTYAFVMAPALDATDRRQLRGCLEDTRIDHLQADVLSIERL